MNLRTASFSTRCASNLIAGTTRRYESWMLAPGGYVSLSFLCRVFEVPGPHVSGTHERGMECMTRNPCQMHNSTPVPHSWNLEGSVAEACFVC